MNNMCLSRVALGESIGNLGNIGRGSKRAVSMTTDGLLSALSVWGAYSLRFGEPFQGTVALWHVLVLTPLLTVLVFHALGIYRWVVRSSTQRLYTQLLKGCLVSAGLLALILFVLPADTVKPRSVIPIYAMLFGLGTCGLRAWWQNLFDSGHQGEPIAIYGAGAAGRQLVSLLGKGDEYRPMVFIDDNPRLTNATVAGLPVVSGTSANLIDQLAKLEVRRIVIAIASLSSEGYQRKLQQLEDVCVPVQTIPGFTELLNGSAQPGEIRDISIMDILGRQEVPPDPELLGRCVTGKQVMVTGGGGSIGSELCRQIIALKPATLIVVDNCEANLYHITEELRFVLNRMSPASRPELVPILCSVTDEFRIRSLLANRQIDTIYHAAAYKHVPIVENQPEQGVEVNVFGTLCVLNAAIDHAVGNFVLISTDKAVRPANCMGASKRTAELILQAKAQESTRTRICVVRFGNVLGSSGSVVPKFKKQIMAGGPITITHPEITRFFMTIPEAAQLVMQASAISEGGAVFVLDMGKPVRIIDMAHTMVKLYGKRLKSETGNDRDIDIVIEGLRPGEKMYEELFITDDHRRTVVPKVFTADEYLMPWYVLSTHLDRLRAFTAAGDVLGVRDELFTIANSNTTFDPLPALTEPSVKEVEESVASRRELDTPKVAFG